MVDPAVVDGDRAVGVRTGGLHRLDRRALLDGGEALRPTLVEHDSGTVEHDRDDVGLARQSTCRLDRDGNPAVGLAQRLVPTPTGEGADVDVDDDDTADADE